MTLSVRPLRDDDADAFCALLRGAEAGPIVDRSPDPFAQPRASGPAQHAGAFEDGRLVAAAGVVRQLRHVEGRARETHYLCDARVLPEFRGTLALALVVRSLRAAYAGARFCHATVLESNPRLRALSRGSASFGAGRLLGRTRHVAWPVFLDSPLRVRGLGIEEAPADEALTGYSALAPALDFSPADEARFRDGGRFFVRRRAGGITSVCKLVDESPRRRLLCDGATDRVQPALDALSRARGFPGIPRKGGAWTISYLSCFVSSDGLRPAQMAVAAGSIDRRATHVCFGEDAASPAPRHPLAVHFTSSTWGYGEVPEGLSLQCHELTWM